MIGKTISHYKILEKLGEGGMGVVYKAEDTKLKRTVALKFLSPRALGGEEDRTRLVHEAQAAAALTHSGICTVYEIDEVDGQMFIAMEYVEGLSLKDRIASGPLKVEEALSIIIQVAEGLQKAHEKGTVHRDIKSANIMITSDCKAKIMDFGLAKLAGGTKFTKIGTTVGTVAYMSPEQARGEGVDHRTDIWSLGILLYEMLTGRLPFTGDYEQAVVYSILNEEPEPITALRTGLSMEAERIASKAMAKSPDERYQDVRNMLVDLRALRKAQGIGLKHPPITVKPGKKSIAVLPFKSLSESKEDEYFSDGITEDILTQLSKISDLRVISRTSVTRYKGTEKSLTEIGEELGVATILEGSVRRSGGRIRIVGQLIDARTDEHIWAEKYDREMEDVFDIQSDVAQKIALALKAKLSPEEKERIEKKPTDNLTAYDYYLKGHEYYNRLRKQDNENAIGLFKKALELDPDYALAYAGLGDAYGQRTQRFGFPAIWLDSAIEVSEKAISIDPDCPEAHKALGVAYAVKGCHRKSLAAYRRAVELNPNLYPAVANIGRKNCDLGRYDEALVWLKKALALNPTFPFTYSCVGYVYSGLGDYDRAELWFNKALELQPDLSDAHTDLVGMYIEQGRYDQAIAQSQKALSVAPDAVLALNSAAYAEFVSGNFAKAREHYEKTMEISTPEIPSAGGVWFTTRLAYIYWKTGEKEKARKILSQRLEADQKSLAQGSDWWRIPYDVAAVNAIRGDEAEAYVWLQRAIDAGWRRYRMASADPLFENLHNDGQFKKMMADVKVMVDEMRRRVEEAEERTVSD